MLDNNQIETFKRSVEDLLGELSKSGLVCVDDLSFKEERWCAHYYRLTAESDKVRLSSVVTENGVSVFSLSLRNEETKQWHTLALGEPFDVSSVDICQRICTVLENKPS